MAGCTDSKVDMNSDVDTNSDAATDRIDSEMHAPFENIRWGCQCEEWGIYLQLFQISELFTCCGLVQLDWEYTMRFRLLECAL